MNEYTDFWQSVFLNRILNVVALWPLGVQNALVCMAGWRLMSVVDTRSNLSNDLSPASGDRGVSIC